MSDYILRPLSCLFQPFACVSDMWSSVFSTAAEDPVVNLAKTALNSANVNNNGATTSWSERLVAVGFSDWKQTALVIGCAMVVFGGVYAIRRYTRSQIPTEAPKTPERANTDAVTATPSATKDDPKTIFLRAAESLKRDLTTADQKGQLCAMMASYYLGRENFDDAKKIAKEGKELKGLNQEIKQDLIILMTRADVHGEGSARKRLNFGVDNDEPESPTRNPSNRSTSRLVSSQYARENSKKNRNTNIEVEGSGTESSHWKSAQSPSSSSRWPEHSDTVGSELGKTGGKSTKKMAQRTTFLPKPNDPKAVINFSAESRTGNFESLTSHLDPDESEKKVSSGEAVEKVIEQGLPLPPPPPPPPPPSETNKGEDKLKENSPALPDLLTSIKNGIKLKPLVASDQADSNSNIAPEGVSTGSGGDMLSTLTQSNLIRRNAFAPPPTPAGKRKEWDD